MEVRTIKTRIFKPREDLDGFIKQYVKKLPDRSVLVVTSKIVALAEGRLVRYESPKQKEDLIKKESQWAKKTKYTWLTIKDNTVMSSAGIDESNADGQLILLPKDSFKTAQTLRSELKKYYKVKNLGVLITDSRLMPLRAGVVGVAVGYAGFKGIRNYIGKPDLFGRKLTVSRTDVADSLATTAGLVMGEGREQTPLGVILDAPVEFVDKIKKQELHIEVADDVYGPLYRKLWRNKRG